MSNTIVKVVNQLASSAWLKAKISNFDDFTFGKNINISLCENSSILDGYTHSSSDQVPLEVRPKITIFETLAPHPIGAKNYNDII